MNKWLNTFALAFVLFLGSNYLWATPYPGGGGGDVTASSTTTFTNKTIDANATGNSITNIDLSADVTGELPHASTSNDTSQVHGLGSSVFVMGNLISAGDSLQYAATNPGAVGSSDQAVYRLNIAITFPTAYSGTPDGVGSAGSTDTSGLMASASDALTTTGMSFKILSNTSAENLTDVRYMVIGQ